jgi:hypothetical protein
MEEKTVLFKDYVDWAKTNKRGIFTFQEFCRKLMNDPELAGLIYRTKDMDIKPCFGGIRIKEKITKPENPPSDNPQQSL